MGTVEKIYEVLQENLSHPPEVWLENLIEHGCEYRHHLALLGTQAVEPERAQDIILREANRGLRKMVKHYMEGCFGERFASGFTISLNGTVLVDFTGILDELTLVEVVPLPTKVFQQGALPKFARLATAAKTHLAGATEAICITIDRDKQDWASWKISGRFRPTAEVIERESRFISTLQNGDGAKMGTASRTTCSHCPFRNSCDADPVGDPEAFPEELRFALDPALVTQLDQYLWSLNDVDHDRDHDYGRRISPSHFSVTPCDRAVAYNLLGTRQKTRIDPKLRRIFDAGHAFHNVLQAALYWAYPDDFTEEVRMSIPEYHIEGTCDGILREGGRGFELKSIGSNGFAKLSGAKTDHVKQATIYQRGIKFDLMEYIYVCKEDGCLKAFELPEDHKTWHKIADRAERVVKSVDEFDSGNGELPPQLVGKDYECRKCKYGWKCRPELFRTNQQAALRRRFANR